MKRIFISQPMRGLSDAEILSKRQEIVSKVESIVNDEVEIIDSFFEDFKPENNIPVKYLSRSIDKLADADIAYFGGDWKEARGCKIEHEIAIAYGIQTIEE